MDLIKAFDTANHELLFQLLHKYGAPEQLIAVIKKLHTNFKLKFKLEGLQEIIDYTVGVKQGDSMAPLLFLFLMQAMFQTLQKKIDSHQSLSAHKINFKHFPDTKTGKPRGRIYNQPNPEKTKGQDYNLTGLLFADDGALLTNSRENLCILTDLVFNLKRRFGLLMHVGQGKTKSKTEAMYFPANPKDFDPTSKPENITFGSENEYHIHFTNKFKYLGTQTTPQANDDEEIDTRLRQASNQTSALSNFFHSTADIHTKRMIFLAIPVNTALYGCESWALTKKHEKKITAFFHKGLRKIMRIDMGQVKDHHIRNEHLRNKLTVEDPLVTIRARQAKFLGRLARMPDHRLPRKFLNAWIAKPRHTGRPAASTKATFVSTLRDILGPPVDEHGRLQTWIPTLKQEAHWNETINNWRAKTLNDTLETYGSHPLLGPPITQESQES